jgi:surfactin synthase thioesterase subunit
LRGQGDSSASRRLWLDLRPGVERPSRTMFLIGHAGAGTGNLRPFARLLPQDWSVWALALPGRDRRLDEPADWRLAEVSQQAAAAAAEVVAGNPEGRIVVIGQCLGGWLGYSLLADGGMQMQARCEELVIVSQSPWHAPRPEARLPSDSDAMWGGLAAAGDVPAEIAEDDEFRELLEPAVRADYAALAEMPRDARPISCPILAIGGTRDPARELLNLPEWKRYTPSAEVAWLDAGHLPLQDDPGSLAALLAVRYGR